jgi:hypothetical protein
MLGLFWALLLLLALCTGLLLLAPRGKQIDKADRTSRADDVPETPSSVAVCWRALRAAFASLRGKPKV